MFSSLFLFGGGCKSEEIGALPIGGSHSGLRTVYFRYMS